MTASSSSRERYLTTEEVAAELRVPAETLRYWRSHGRGPKSFKLPGARRVLYARDDVDAYVQAARSGAELEAAGQ